MSSVMLAQVLEMRRTASGPNALPVPFRVDEHDLVPQRFANLDADHARSQATVCLIVFEIPGIKRRESKPSVEQTGMLLAQEDRKPHSVVC